jgi:electron transfer flavoprotein alpha subunit
MSESYMSSILVILEQRSGVLNRTGFETLAAGAQLASALGIPLEAAILGNELADLPQQIARHGAAKVHAVEHPLLAQYTADGFARAAEQLIRATSPRAVLFPHTYQVRDWAPKLATRFGCAFVSDVVDARVDAGAIGFVRQLFQGKWNAEIRTAPQGLAFASFQAGAFRAAEPFGSSAEITPFAPQIDASAIRSKPEEPFREAQRSVDLSAAERIVAVGRGIKEKENIPLAQQLADAIGAELAASRPICDNGWLPMERQVGSSGQTVAPKLYLALGISGAIQHLVGMKGAKTIVAINSDPSAPIFEIADYGIVGDLFQVVPALVGQIKKAKA